jgi:predicted metal-dependent enzyme (double-stranded beta helix superfamily)
VERLILSCVFCLALAVFTPAQTSHTNIDNNQAKVLSVTVEPHQKTPVHQHVVNRVMIYLQGGRQKIDYQGWQESVVGLEGGRSEVEPGQRTARR